MKLNDIRTLIVTRSDFCNQQPEIVKFLQTSEFECIFLPKLHCELNPVEKCWSQAKHYTRADTNYTIH